jgi:hypothetical protein
MHYAITENYQAAKYLKIIMLQKQYMGYNIYNEADQI